MSDIAIKVENLGKKYIIKHEKQEPYKTFQDVLLNTGKKIITSLNPFADKKSEDETTEAFWALKDVNFEIKKGDKVGIIGRNGAGKSTLLKVLSRITEPTTGKIHINGRIASLLEVGTGFHPELTGRENIYLNGAILGMSRAEIKAKFDEIVAFAEVEKFLDTPVKRYSSGMYVRLAFSVAAHLEPEILVVDEVLAVGDAEFQKKCLGKMGEVSEDGRTVIFVSHNMNAIEQLCNSALLMEHGELKASGYNVASLIRQYLHTDSSGERKDAFWKNNGNEFDNAYFRPTYFAVVDETHTPLKGAVKNNETFFVILEGEIENLNNSLVVGYALYDESNTMLFYSMFNDTEEASWPKIRHGTNRLRTQIPKRFLNEGRYRLEIVAVLHNKEWLVTPMEDAPTIFFEVQGGLSDSPFWMGKRAGILAPVITWENF